MQPKNILFLTLLLAGWFACPITATAFGGPPPGPEPDLPGASRGKVETYWLAPYVLVSQIYGKMTVTWFAEDGHVKRQADVISVEPGFVDIGNGITVGVNEDWTITLPPESPPIQSRFSMSGYITSTPDSRVFVHEYHPEPGRIALDIYVHGKLTHTVGPFWQYQGRSVDLHEDGGATLPIWKDEAHSTAQILTTDTNGLIRARVDCGQNVDSPNIAPDEKPHSPASNLGLHIPGNEKAQVLAVGSTSNLAIYAVAELYEAGPWRGAQWTLNNNGKEWVRAFYAVQDGNIVARWQAPHPQRLEGEERDHFLSLDGKLYFITANEFVELNPDDIISKKNGWR